MDATTSCPISSLVHLTKEPFPRFFNASLPGDPFDEPIMSQQNTNSLLHNPIAPRMKQGN